MDMKLYEKFIGFLEENQSKLFWTTCRLGCVPQFFNEICECGCKHRCYGNELRNEKGQVCYVFSPNERKIHNYTVNYLRSIKKDVYTGRAFLFLMEKYFEKKGGNNEVS